MKHCKTFIITAILTLFSIVNLSFAQSTVQDTAYNHSSDVVFPEMTPQLVDNLDLLGRVWGFLKYHHPTISKGTYNWDEELFKMLPGYLKVTDNKQRDAYLAKWILRFGKIPVNKNSRSNKSGS